MRELENPCIHVHRATVAPSLDKLLTRSIAKVDTEASLSESVESFSVGETERQPSGGFLNLMAQGSLNREMIGQLKYI